MLSMQVEARWDRCAASFAKCSLADFRWRFTWDRDDQKCEMKHNLATMAKLRFIRIEVQLSGQPVIHLERMGLVRRIRTCL
jgi:hypothetical protein